MTTSDQQTQFKTKKAAREAGLVSEHVFELKTVHSLPLREAVPVATIKGESFYAKEQIEKLISATEAKRRKLTVADAEPAKYGTHPGARDSYRLYRVSDLRPPTEEEKQAEQSKRREADRRRREERNKEAQRRRDERARVEVVIQGPVKIPKLPDDELREMAEANAQRLRDRRSAARAAYEERCCARGEELDFAFGGSAGEYDEQYLARITVNYLRHEHTAYDYLIGSLEEVRYEIWESSPRDPSQVHLQAMRELLEREIPTYTRKVFEAIANVYPHLAEECSRQLAERRGMPRQ